MDFLVNYFFTVQCHTSLLQDYSKDRNSVRLGSSQEGQSVEVERDWAVKHLTSGRVGNTSQTFERDGLSSLVNWKLSKITNATGNFIGSRKKIWRSDF